MKQSKVKKHTVGFFRNDAEVPFINLEMFETIKQATGIPHSGVTVTGMSHSFGMLV